MNIRSFIKELAGSAYFHSILGKNRLRDAGVVLMLHRVLPQEKEASLAHRQPLCIGQESFEVLLSWLQRYFTCVPLEQLLEGSTGSRPRLALTFDDGWSDNADIVYPLLTRYEMPASIFLSTDFIGTERRFWWESIGESLWSQATALEARPLLDALAMVARPVPSRLLKNDRSRSRSLELASYLQSLKGLSVSQLQMLADLCPAPERAHAMDWSQVQEMERSGLVRFGPHGASHSILVQLSDQELNAEVQRSRDAIAQHCAAPLPVYCYPNGNHDARVRSVVAAAGYRYALSNQAGLLHAQCNPFALPRIDLSHAAAKQPALLAWRLLRGAWR